MGRHGVASRLAGDTLNTAEIEERMIVIRPRSHPFGALLSACLWAWVALGPWAGTALAQAPAPGEPWTVVAIGDSFVVGIGVARRSDAFPWAYARLLAQDLGVPVEVINHATGELRPVSAWADWLAATDRVRADLVRSDLVVVSLGFHDVLPSLTSGAAWPDPLRGQLEAVVERSPESWDAFFSVLTAAVPSHAGILVAEGGLPKYLFDRFGGHPDWQEITHLSYLAWRDAMVEAAGRYGVRVVPMFEAANGPNGDTLLSPESWWPDGLHIFEDGHLFVAELFRAHDGIGGDP